MNSELTKGNFLCDNIHKSHWALKNFDLNRDPKRPKNHESLCLTSSAGGATLGYTS